MGAIEDAVGRRFAALRAPARSPGWDTDQKPGRAPSVEGAFEAVPTLLARARLIRGT